MQSSAVDSASPTTLGCIDCNLIASRLLHSLSRLHLTHHCIPSLTGAECAERGVEWQWRSGAVTRERDRSTADWRNEQNNLAFVMSFLLPRNDCSTEHLKSPLRIHLIQPRCPLRIHFHSVTHSVVYSSHRQRRHQQLLPLACIPSIVVATRWMNFFFTVIPRCLATFATFTRCRVIHPSHGDRTTVMLLTQ